MYFLCQPCEFQKIVPVISDLNTIFSRAAFFRGQIEHPGTSKFRIRSLEDDPVYVAVNTEGVFILDMDDVVSCMQHTSPVS